MKTKMIEIRDSMTCIPAVAIKMEAANLIEDCFLWRCGYPRDGRGVVLMRLNDNKATSDFYEWPSMTGNTRTMLRAHDYIERNWDDLRDGSVVDVRTVLGETEAPADPEIWTEGEIA